MAGKTHSRHVRVVFGGADLSGDSRSLGGLGTVYDTVEVNGWTSTGLKERLMGHGDVTFGPYQALFNTTAAAIGPTNPGTHVALSAVGQPVASAFIGSGAAPVIGDPVFSSETQQTTYLATGGNSDAVVIQADFTTKANGTNIADWGLAHGVGTSVSSTTNNASVDLGATSTLLGGYGILHICQSVGAMGTNNWAVKIQDSANNSTWADIGTFAATGATATAEIITIAGTIRRYTRAVLTKTAGTDLVAWINLIRI